MREANHLARMTALWLIISIIAEWLILAVLPIPGPNLSTEGAGEHFTMSLLMVVGAPIFVFVCVFLAYSAFAFRDRGEEVAAEQAPVKGNPRLLFIWSLISLTTVFFLAAWGIFTLNEVTDAAGPNPLRIQVIAQQWAFTYRYPSYGGVESRELVIPVGRAIRFEVNSLDVVHEFWIYKEDVKIDAVPGVPTYANLKTDHIGSATVECNELCGIWHGYMRNPMRVVSQKDFTTWISRQITFAAPLKGIEVPFSDVYYPGNTYASPPQNSAQ